MCPQPTNKKSSENKTGITAGGEVSLADVSGQIAIGEYINQFKIENPSAEALIELIKYQDKRRKFNEDIFKCYAPSALPDYPPKLREFVTENRVYEINQALIYLQDHRILFLSGLGGIGKTTLARAMVEIRPANVPIPFWFDFSKKSDATLGDVLEKLAGYLSAPEILQFKEEKKEAEQDDINRLTDELGKRDIHWLIFDNLETALDNKNFHDPGIDSLFTSLRSSTHQAKIIITSRTLPILADGGSLIDVIEDEIQELKGLKTNFAVDYLVKNGLDKIEQSQLEELATGVDGHPLALKLLVGLIKKFGVKDTLNDFSTFQRHKEDTIKKARKLFDKLAGDEKKLLERISVFRQPEPKTAIEKMFTATTSKYAIENLMDKSLLETDHDGNFWLHPLVREFAYDDLENKIEVHKFVHQYYFSLPLPETRTSKEDVQSLIEAHYHACKAKDYDKALNVIFDNNLHEDLDNWGNYRILIELCNGVLPEDHLNDKPLLDDISNHGSVLGNLGNAFSHLGEVEKAIEYYKQALAISKEIGDRRGEGNRLGNLGLAFSHFGEVEKAIEYYEQALAISKEIDDRRGEGDHLGNLGVAFSYLGEVEKAIEYYKQALAISKEIGDRRGEGNRLGNLGLAFSHLGEVEKAIKYYEQALAISKEIGYRRGEGNRLGNLGLAFSHFGEVEKAIEYYEQALAISKEIGYRRGEGAHLGNLGLAFSHFGEVEKAIEYYEQALAISKEIGYRRNEGVDLGNLGNAFRDLGEVEKAIEYYEQALAISKEIGYRRNEGVDLGNLGNAFRDLGEVEKAIEYYEQALAISKEIGYRRGEGVDLGNLGNAFRDLGEVEKAIEYYEQALAISKEIGYRRNEGVDLGNLGNAFRDLGEVEKAIEYYEQALAISKEIGDRRNEGNWLGNLGIAYGALGQVEKAIEYYEQALIIGKEIKDPRLIDFCENNL